MFHRKKEANSSNNEQAAVAPVPIADLSCEGCCIESPPHPASFIFLALCLTLSLMRLLKELDNRPLHYAVIIENNDSRIVKLLGEILQYNHSEKDQKTLLDFKFKIHAGVFIGRQQLSTVLDILKPIAESENLLCDTKFITNFGAKS